MGIRFLYTYMTNIGAFYEINVKNEIDKFRRNNNGEKPLIIIDLLSIHDMVYTNDKEKLLGGRYNVYNSRAEKMFKTITDLGCNIICVSDGSLFADKIPTTLKRRDKTYAESVEILHGIDSGILDLNDPNIGKKFRISNITPFFSNLRRIASKYGEIVRSVREADQEIVYLANKKKALAIIADDSDFLIFKGDWQYWSGSKLNLDTLTTMKFDKAMLRSDLSLSSEQLILFATLSGNDFLRYEVVKEFHRRLTREYIKFQAIADLVRQIRSLPPNLTEYDEKYLLNLIFGRNEYANTAGLKDFRNSIKFYSDVDCAFKNPSIDPAVAHTDGFIRAILVNQPEIFGLLYFDYTSKEFMSYYQLTQPFIRSAMGILLKNRNEKNVTRQIYCKQSHFDPYGLIIETPIYPSYDLPTIIELMTKENDAELDHLRLKLLCWSISPNSRLNPNVISNLPNEQVLSILIIFILVEKKQITLEEADCLLFASVSDSSFKKNLTLDDIKKIDGRATRISFLFTRMFAIISQFPKILGLRSYGQSLVTFDGLFYHYLLQNWNKHNFTSTLNSLNENYASLKIYSPNFNLLTF